MRIVARVDWQGGFAEASSGSGYTRTITVDGGNVDTAAKAQELAVAVLNQHLISPRQSITTRLGSADPTPAVGQYVGTFDTTGSVVSNRLITRRVNTTKNGMSSLVPTLRSPSEIQEAKQARRVSRLSAGSDVNGRYNGSRGGFAQIRHDNVLTGTLSAPSLSRVSFSPLDEGKVSPVQEITNYLIITKTTIKFFQRNVSGGETPTPLFFPVGNVVFKVYVSGVLETFMNVQAGAHEYSAVGQIPLVPGDSFSVVVDAISTPPTYQETDQVNVTIEFDTAYGYLERREDIQQRSL